VLVTGMAILINKAGPRVDITSNAEGEAWKQPVEKKSSALFFQ